MGANVPGRWYWPAQFESVQAPCPMTISRRLIFSYIAPVEPMRMMFSTPNTVYSSQE